MGRYITKAERENMITLDALTSRLVFQIVPNADKLGKEVAKRLRTAATNLKAGMEAYQQSISADDLKKLQRENATTQLVITSRSYVPKEADGEDEEKIHIIHALADYAIGKECRGCTKPGEICELKHLLAAIDLPYTTDEPENCPYEMPGVDA